MKILGRLIGTPRQLSCRRVGQVLQSYLDSELDVDGALKVSAHLEDCRRCGLEADAYEAVKAALRSRTTASDKTSVARLREFAARLSGDGLDPTNTGAR